MYLAARRHSCCFSALTSGISELQFPAQQRGGSPGYTAGMLAEYGRDMPRTSRQEDIELAVNIPPQAPAPGHACALFKSNVSEDTGKKESSPHDVLPLSVSNLSCEEEAVRIREREGGDRAYPSRRRLRANGGQLRTMVERSRRLTIRLESVANVDVVALLVPERRAVDLPGSGLDSSSVDDDLE